MRHVHTLGLVAVVALSGCAGSPAASPEPVNAGTGGEAAETPSAFDALVGAPGLAPDKATWTAETAEATWSDLGMEVTDGLVVPGLSGGEWAEPSGDLEALWTTALATAGEYGRGTWRLRAAAHRARGASVLVLAVEVPVVSDPWRVETDLAAWIGFSRLHLHNDIHEVTTFESEGQRLFLARHAVHGDGVYFHDQGWAVLLVGTDAAAVDAMWQVLPLEVDAPPPAGERDTAVETAGLATLMAPLSTFAPEAEEPAALGVLRRVAASGRKVSATLMFETDDVLVWTDASGLSFEDRRAGGQGVVSVGASDAIGALATLFADEGPRIFELDLGYPRPGATAYGEAMAAVAELIEAAGGGRCAHVSPLPPERWKCERGALE